MYFLLAVWRLQFEFNVYSPHHAEDEETGEETPADFSIECPECQAKIPVRIN